MIPFQGYQPDQADFGNPGEAVAINVVPEVGGYGPIKALQTITDAMTDRAQGATVVKDKNGNSFIYAGDKTNLYQLTQSTQTAWTDISGSTYATDADDMWEFIKWKEKVLATNFTDEIQSITIGGGAFADLVSEPRARHIAAVRSFVVVGNTWDSVDGNIPFRVRWSGIDDETTFTVSATTLSDFQDLAGDGGWVNKVVGGEFGVVFQEKSIWRMTFIGSPAVFQFDEVLPGRGTPAPGSVVQVGDSVYFLAQDGFQALEGGAKVRPIGVNRVDNTFFADLDESNVLRMTSTADPATNRVFWAYPGAGNTSGRPNKVLIYDWSLNRWSTMEDELELFAVQATGGFTLDTLDTFTLGSELVTNGAFAADTDWTKGGRWTISAGTATHTP